MALIDLKSAPSDSMKKWFGLSLSILLLIIAFGLRNVSSVACYATAFTAVILGSVYYLIPASQLKIIRGWQLLTYPIAWVLSHLMLGTVYYLILCPIGFALRATKHDPLHLRNPEVRSTAWQRRSDPKSTASYFKQF